jgi:hypothetical protein
MKALSTKGNKMQIRNVTNLLNSTDPTVRAVANQYHRAVAAWTARLCDTGNFSAESPEYVRSVEALREEVLQADAALTEVIGA